MLGALIPAPYRLPAAALLVALVLGGAYAKGRIDGHRSGVRDSVAQVQKADRRAAAAGDALQAAAGRLTEDARIFRMIDAQVAADMKRAATARQAAAQSAARAAAESARLRRTLSGLEQRLRSERATCEDGSKPICGVPLQ